MNQRVCVILATFAAFLLAGCGDGDGAAEQAPTSYKVNYEVVINSTGAIKVTYKDNTGQVVVEDPVVANAVGFTWKEQFSFQDAVDAMLTVELPESSPPDPVGVEMFIAVNDARVQKATKFVTKKNGMTLTVTRP